MVSASQLLEAPVSERIALPRLATEQGVAPPTTWRWSTGGVAGVVLPTVCIGSRRYTTRAAFRWWCEAVTLARSGRVASRTCGERESAIERAETELDQLTS